MIDWMSNQADQMQQHPDELFCDHCGSVPCQCPTIRAPFRPPADGLVTFDQDVWWQTADGVTHLIDDLEQPHLANIARLLRKNAHVFFTKMRTCQEWDLFISYNAAADEAWERGSWGPGNWDSFDDEAVALQVMQEIADGKHLVWLESTQLYRRLSRDIDPRDYARPPDRGASDLEPADF